ncbi:ABC transporter permease [Nonomuraea sp. NPDC003707]
MDAARELAGGLDLGQTAAVIEVHGLHMAYGHKEVLRGVDPLGAIIGSLVGSPQGAGALSMIAIGGLTAISGIFYPITALAGWLQGLAHVFPLYWLGLGMRSALLPDSAAAAEIGSSWRPVETTLVLLAWAVAGLVLAPPILRRVARRESGSLMEARRHQAMQRLT